MSEITIPTPEVVIPGFADLPEPIQAVIERLSRPFAIEEVKVRPGAVKRDGTAALALAYLDWWTGYLPRLNDEVGPNNWSIALQPWGEHQIIARLTAFGGQIVSESTGSAKGDANGAQEAEVQAKKRACAEGLMLGLYLYFLPKVWGKGERVGKDFSFGEGEERRCVYEMYARAGLVAHRTSGVEIPRPAAATHRIVPASTPARAAAPVTERAAAARAALDTAERRLGLRPREDAAAADHATSSTTTTIQASDKQLGLIVRLVNARRADTDTAGDDAVATAIDAIGARFGITGLSDIRKKDQLRSSAAGLTILNASRLIDALKALDSDALAPAA
jgi:hypothetical protein